VDKKPLIVVSICAVVLLVLGSLSNVVGYQSVKSSTVNDSPIFQTRTQRATNQQQNIITSQYLGMGNGNLLQFPSRDNRTEQLKKAINIISKMDDKTFERFTELCIQRARQVNTLSDTNPNEITRVLNQLRTIPETITYSFTNRNYQNKTSSDLYTIDVWFPGYILNIIFVVIMIIFALIFYIFYLGEDFTVSCGPEL
jgi:hypothetical protein